MKNNCRYIFQIGLILFGAAFIGLLITHIRNKNEVRQLEIKNKALIEVLEQSKKGFEQRLKSLGEKTKMSTIKSANVIELHSWDIEEMKKRGLKGPVKDIISDLMQHRELIPYKGSLGGTMNFYSAGKIWILTKKWVLAYFEDGHNRGYLLLEYEVTNDGRIKWKVLASYIA
jgi:hypothetical protein